MGIRQRFEDTILLLRDDRLEGALLMALVAIEGTSRKRYPDTVEPSPGKAFQRFLEDEMDKVLPIKRLVLGCFRDGKMLLHELLYRIVRNDLHHEGGLPPDVEVVRTADFQIRQENGKAIFSDRFICALLNAVMQARENKDLFPERDQFWPSWLPYRRPPGQ